MRKRIITHQGTCWIEVYNKYTERWERVNKLPGTDTYTTNLGVSIQFNNKEEAIEYSKKINIEPAYLIEYII